ncbi:MobP2 family relaxase [Streptococcus canis]|uniref:MobP2 family relaxase n=1 Tax=Streptococcus canis TaxID=1329 RepID=UPI002F9697DE
MNMTNPAITFMMQYTRPNTRYVDYTNREEATAVDNELALENQRQTTEDLTEDQIQAIYEQVPEQDLSFKDYIDYMNRSYATENQSEEMTAIFTQETNYLEQEKVAQLKEKLQEAYRNESLLWQGVISFDNTFLAEQGLYNLETHQVDQTTLKQVMRETIPQLIKAEGLSETAFWWGNIHLNTDNIHIHFGLSELESNRDKIYYEPRKRWEYRGNFKQKSLKQVKSSVYHGLLKENAKEDLLRKEQILANLKTQLLAQVMGATRQVSSTEKNFLEQAYRHLPKDKPWRYGSHAKDFAVSKFFLDKYIDAYLEQDGNESYQVFLEETKAFLQNFEGAYSAEKNKGYTQEALVTKRVNELRERIGNHILRYLKEHADDALIMTQPSNLSQLSITNQERILAQFPEASFVQSREAWEKEGYTIPETAIPLWMIKPIYHQYDKYGNGIGQPTFEKVAMFDIRHVDGSHRTERLSLSHLADLSKTDLETLIGLTKDQKELSDKDRQSLGLYRYALKRYHLEEKQVELKLKERLLHQWEAQGSDGLYKEWKLADIRHELSYVQLQLTPNYQLTPADMACKETLSRAYQDPKALPIDKASQDYLRPLRERLSAEKNLIGALQDQTILSLLEGQEITPATMVKQLDNRLSLLDTKAAIHDTNQKIAQTSDSELQKQLRQENGRYFAQLKQLEKEFTPVASAEKNNRLKQSIQNQLQRQKQSYAQKRISSSGRFSTNFMKGMSMSLKSLGNSQKRALQSRRRQEEREEREKQNR